jgi:hypothetical protein
MKLKGEGSGENKPKEEKGKLYVLHISWKQTFSLTFAEVGYSKATRFLVFISSL